MISLYYAYNLVCLYEIPLCGSTSQRKHEVFEESLTADWATDSFIAFVQVFQQISADFIFN